LLGRKSYGAKPEAILETNTRTGKSRLYETDAFGRKEIYSVPKAIIETGRGGVSRFYETDAFGRRAWNEKPALLIESR
jgi:hypothetical protein